MGAFKTKARAVELLGRKQIRDSVTALAELMKNSYDADAGYLRVDFLTKDVIFPCIVVCDTGEGMDKEDLENKWLVLGTPTKSAREKRKTAGGRPVMGEKGIGRLAVSRLGQQMWMFTKKKDTGWNVLYINWNIFENPDLYIEDIEIPVTYNRSLKEIPDIIDNLRNIQMDNLRGKSWCLEHNISRKELIQKQIKSYVPDADTILDFCGIIESKESKQGTIIISLNLNDEWERYLDKKAASEEDTLAIRNYNRLNSFVSNFEKSVTDFQVELFYNNELLVFTAAFNDEDYNSYDLKIEGIVEHGIFKGKIDARNGDTQILDQCNEVLNEGIRVTNGLRNWERDDCGEYKVKICHFEMKEENTGLTKDELLAIRKRMGYAGGVGIYRDNVRVLPYGEPDNDFLELEKNRSKSATYYLFSHRNMFGRIDISSEKNPYLEDKSSREGFIENQYYNYFIKTLQNLLVCIAVDFVGDMKKNSFKLRQSYINYNKAEKEKKEKLKAFEKEQERLFKEDQQRVKSLLADNSLKLKEFEAWLDDRIARLRFEYENDDRHTYRELLNKNTEIKNFSHEMLEKLEREQKALLICINKRFESIYPLQLLNQVDTFNEEVYSGLRELKIRLDVACESLTDTVENRISEFEMREGVVLQEAVNDLKFGVQNVETTLSQLNSDALKKVQEQYTELMKKTHLINTHERDVNLFKQKCSQNIEGNFSKQKDELKRIGQKIDQLTLEDAAKEMESIRTLISQTEKRIFGLSESVAKENEKYYDDINGRLDMVLESFRMNDAALIESLLARNNELRQLNDLYTDLANLGMAAEIVSHELSQLFNNVYDAINQMRLQKLTADSKYYLGQIDIGFRAISNRFNQMEPMYRNRNLYTKNVNIYRMLEDLRRFFENRLKKSDINFINNVPQTLELKLSLSKIYPVLSNLIYNSMYWVEDQSKREILFHFDEEENALYVEDSGIGIKIRNKERVFEPFFSLKPNGRGLGLTISKNVLESQGHQIEAILESDNKQLNGACFKITFDKGKE